MAGRRPQGILPTCLAVQLVTARQPVFGDAEQDRLTGEKRQEPKRPVREQVGHAPAEAVVNVRVVVVQAGGEVFALRADGDAEQVSVGSLVQTWFETFPEPPDIAIFAGRDDLRAVVADGGRQQRHGCAR
jgi:hypothetical protein